MKMEKPKGKHIGFQKLETKLKGKVEDPGAVAAKIGIEKYGKEKMMKAAKTGKPLKQSQAKKK